MSKQPDSVLHILTFWRQYMEHGSGITASPLVLSLTLFMPSIIVMVIQLNIDRQAGRRKEATKHPTPSEARINAD